jgi:ubiquinone/menaquinone biosynthesis C-methylase UbiE
MSRRDHGYVAARAAERGAEPIGVDFSDTMLAYARAHVAGVEFVHGDATAAVRG